jgi:hypothetical protein
MPGSKWKFVFTSWTDVARYRIPLTDEAARRLEADLDAEERKLYAGGLHLEQIAWRRDKMRELALTPMMFRRDFPRTPLEPFMTDASGWFNQESLVDLATYVPELGRDAQTELRVFHEYDPDRQYVIGMDTSGGVGRDESVIVVLRDDLLHVAIWATNRASPAEQAVMLMRLATRYGNPTCIVEANNHGLDVINRATLLGVTLWKDEYNDDFWSEGGRAGHSKRMACVHAREMIDAQWTVINDDLLIDQATKFVQRPNGKIEASEGHDDRIMAYVLALWAARGLWDGRSAIVRDTARERFERINNRFGDAYGIAK